MQTRALDSGTQILRFLMFEILLPNLSFNLTLDNINRNRDVILLPSYLKNLQLKHHNLIHKTFMIMMIYKWG